MPKHTRIVIAAAVALAVAYTSAPATAAPAVTVDASAATIPMELFSLDGTVTHTELSAQSQPVASSLSTRSKVAAAGLTASVTKIYGSGDTKNRIDIVIVGDGYTEAELGQYATDAAYARDVLTLYTQNEPFRSYGKLINIWRVDVISPVSGVSGDPSPDVVKDTPLAMSYWCGGLERLLCADTDQARAYASLAPDVDEVMAIANSQKYGGAGYTDENLVTFSGQHYAGAWIPPHEFGHSMGDLADEYPYYSYPGDGSTYTGPDPAYANVTKFTADQLTQSKKKWWYWLGTADPAGGVVGAYEGGLYTELGVYRPTENSMMRTLYQPYNSVGREEMVVAFYKVVRPVDAVSPTGTWVGRNGTVTVTNAAPDAFTEITWFVNGKEVTAWRYSTSKTKSFNLCEFQGKADHLTVRVTDVNPWVRNPQYRDTYMTQQFDWSIDNSARC